MRLERPPPTSNWLWLLPTSARDDALKELSLGRQSIEDQPMGVGAWQRNPGFWFDWFSPASFCGKPLA